MFVEALLPIGSAFDNLVRQKGLYDDLQKKSELSQQRADTAKLNAENRSRALDIAQQRADIAQQRADTAQQRADTAQSSVENRKRELDIVESGVRLAQLQYSQGGVHLQMQPVRKEED